MYIKHVKLNAILDMRNVQATEIMPEEYICYKEEAATTNRLSAASSQIAMCH